MNIVIIELVTMEAYNGLGESHCSNAFSSVISEDVAFRCSISFRKFSNKNNSHIPFIDVFEKKTRCPVY